MPPTTYAVGLRLPVAAVCRLFALGQPESGARRVRGAYLNRVWRLRTATGDYAVKVLNPRFRHPDRRREYEATFELERAALLAGVTTAQPVGAVDASWLVELPVGLTRVHRWVDGRPLRDREVEPPHAAAAGGLLARIHTLDLRRPARADDVLRRWTRQQWEAPALDLPELAALLPAMERIGEAIVAGRALWRRPVLSHADVSAKNLLERRDGSVALLDWDAARPAEPRLEVAATALNLAGHTRRRPRPEVLRAFLGGYRAGGGVFHGGDRRLLAGLLNGMLGWLWLNYRRALGGATQAERRDGRRTAARAVREILVTLDALDEWADLLSR
jgi:Ser/Thr protein kinase RdoA (MazF antagonist)